GGEGGWEPWRRGGDVRLALGVCADARDRDQLGELVEPLLGHGGGVYAARDAASWPQAASMSRPRVSRTVAGSPARSSTALNASIARRDEPSNWAGRVYGIRLTLNARRSGSSTSCRACSTRSLTPASITYSTNTLRRRSAKCRSHSASTVASG